jgi:hypothetical protein
MPLLFVISKIDLDLTAFLRNIQYMGSHYAVTGAIRYYIPPPRRVALQGALLAAAGAPASRRDVDYLFRWKEPPHVELANLRDDSESALRFTRIYGALSSDYKGEQGITIPVIQVLTFRDCLRGAWSGEYESLSLILDEAKIVTRMSPAGMDLVPADLWTLIRVIFARDFWDKRAKKCENPDCPAPYFLAVRKGQKFCSQKCAVLINVRHFREREARRTAKKGTPLRHNRKDGEQ